MLRRIHLFVWFAAGSAVLAQDAAPAPPLAAPLSKEEIAAVIGEEAFSLPMPGELFAAMGKHGKPDWSTFSRKAPSATFTSRQQIALNLGALVADGYLAVEAQDKQQIKNIASDIRTLAKGISVSKELISRGTSIVEFAEAGQWDTLKEELEATQNDVIAAMVAHKDQELVTLVMLGGWLRGTEVVSGYISAHHTADAAKVLRQPAIVNHFVQKLAKMPKEMTNTPLMTAVRFSLFEIRKAVSFGAADTPTAEDVKKLNEIAVAIMKAIGTKD